MEFIHKKSKKSYFLVEVQNEDMWEKGYLTVFKLGSIYISYEKMEDLVPVLIQEDIPQKHKIHDD